jgi:hypothetical protein
MPSMTPSTLVGLRPTYLSVEDVLDQAASSG